MIFCEFDTHIFQAFSRLFENRPTSFKSKASDTIGCQKKSYQNHFDWDRRNRFSIYPDSAEFVTIPKIDPTDEGLYGIDLVTDGGRKVNSF